MLLDMLLFTTRDGKKRVRFQYTGLDGKQHQFYSEPCEEEEEILGEINEGICVVEQFGRD